MPIYKYKGILMKGFSIVWLPKNLISNKFWLTTINFTNGTQIWFKNISKPANLWTFKLNKCAKRKQKIVRFK